MRRDPLTRTPHQAGSETPDNPRSRSRRHPQEVQRRRCPSALSPALRVASDLPACTDLRMNRIVSDGTAANHRARSCTAGVGVHAGRQPRTDELEIAAVTSKTDSPAAPSESRQTTGGPRGAALTRDGRSVRLDGRSARPSTTSSAPTTTVAAGRAQPNRPMAMSAQRSQESLAGS